MSLKERGYSILVVSAAEKLNTGLSELLSGPLYRPVKFVHSISSGRRAWNDQSFDFLIISSPLPDDTGISFAVDIGSTRSAAVLLLVRSEIHDEIHERVVEHGVFTLRKPFSRTAFLTALQWMESAREALRKSEKRVLSFEEKMEEIRLVNRAKWLLISELKMDEPQAHRHIEKQAMDRSLPRRTIAEEIIRLYS